MGHHCRAGWLTSRTKGLDAIYDAIAAGVPGGNPTTFGTETESATTVNGTTWVDLHDGTGITVVTEIWGIKVTKGGTWAGLVQLRIIDGSSNKIFPFGDYAEENTDFIDTIFWEFPAPVRTTVGDGYKVQFRSSSAADGAGETLALTELDTIEIG